MYSLQKHLPIKFKKKKNESRIYPENSIYETCMEQLYPIANSTRTYYFYLILASVIHNI